MRFAREEQRGVPAGRWRRQRWA